MRRNHDERPGLSAPAAVSEPGPDAARGPRDVLALALDVDDLVAATRLARALSRHFSVAKVGAELYAAAGPEAVGAMLDFGYEVFCDVKLYDIPNQVRRAARVLGELGVSYLTVHAAGGETMLRAAVEGLASGAADSARVLAVTVLTSEPASEASAALVNQRMALAARSGCGGVICAATDLAQSRQVEPQLLRVVPGVRLVGDSAHDQKRVATPSEALRDGAGLLVVGRPVTLAADPLEAAERLHRDVLGVTMVQRPESR